MTLLCSTKMKDTPQKTRPLQQCVYNQVKQLEIYLLSTGFSTVEDQAGDWILVDCLANLSVPIERHTNHLCYFTVITLKPSLSCEEVKEEMINVEHASARIKNFVRRPTGSRMFV